MLDAIIKGIGILLASVSSETQSIEYFSLPESLNEISGLELVNDTTLVAFNDGDNDPKLFLLNLKGQVLREVSVESDNKDWEAVTRDSEHLYIGDIGNNLNNRKDLVIYKLKIDEVLTKHEVIPEKILFSYAEQKSFPPSNDSLFFDAEGMTFYKDSIWVFTKNRSNPTDGYSLIYKIPTAPGEYVVDSSSTIFVGTNGWLTDGITAVDVFENQFYFLTYDRFFVMNCRNNKLENTTTFKFDQIAQRESIVVLNKASIFVADERNPLIGEVKLYRIKP